MIISRGFEIVFHTRQTIQTALSRHTILSRSPHLRQGQTDVHMFIVQLIRLINREGN